MLTRRSGGSPAKCALNAAILSAFAIAAGSVIAVVTTAAATMTMTKTERG